MLSIDVGVHAFVLLPQRAVLWPAQRLLLVADAHIGKAATFRRHGLAVPGGTTAETLDALSVLVERHGVQRLAFLGDLLHSEHAHTPATHAALARWRERHRSLEVVLVRGNHDDRAGDPPAALGIDAVDEPWCVDGIALCHHPVAAAGAYVMAGHVHPCVHLAGRAHDRLRLPAFWFGPEVAVLPAFGAFTGMHAVQPGAQDRVFVAAGDGVHELPRKQSGQVAAREPAA
jgi:DNA ligase-associated metallophosphoesterase